METLALSPDPTLPPGAPLPRLGHVRLTPTSSVPMLIGQVTPAIFQEALHRTRDIKAAGSDEVTCLVQKHMPHALQEALHLLFKTLALIGITPPPFLGSRASPFSSIRREIRLGWTSTVQSP